MPYISFRISDCRDSNDVDVIVFSVFEHGYKQCSDEPMGTYVTDVPTFVYAYMQQKLQNQQDLGNDDYATPESIQYTSCTRRVVDNVEYFVQLGCSDGTSQALSLNIYKDDTCTERDSQNGSDDANADVSELQVRSNEFCATACYPLSCHFQSTIHHTILTTFLVMTPIATIQEMPSMRQLGGLQ